MGRLIHGDCLDVLPTLDANSIDSCCTDPPYALTAMTKRFGADGAAPAKGPAYQRHNAGFMGHTWDVPDVAFDPATWEAVYRVMKPGAHLVALGGTRTAHRLICAIEDAGFEIRDTLAWLYGQGFPKSHNIGNGWGTSLKPALEWIVLARKPLSEKSVAANTLRWCTGALNIDASRIGTVNAAAGNKPGGAALNMSAQGMPQDAPDSIAQGRWPANVVVSHDPACVETGSREVPRTLIDSTPNIPNVSGIYGEGINGSRNAGTASETIPVYECVETCPVRLVDEQSSGDTGGASRFFYTAKADAAERSPNMAKRNSHPTVKPLALMAWLIKLATPPGGVVLDPFAGSGTTGIAAIGNGFDWVLVEREDEYVQICQQRIGLGCEVIEFGVPKTSPVDAEYVDISEQRTPLF